MYIRLMDYKGYILNENREPVLVPLMDHLLWWTDVHHNGDQEIRIGLDTVGDDEISTVFLPMMDLPGLPKGLFETMVSGGLVKRRYNTWDDALKGHQEVVEELKRG
jgi:hypothetical protein